MDTAQTLKQAIAYHQAGEVGAAQRLYHEVLQQQPQDADASHNLGILLVQAGQPQEALPYLQTALEASPAEAQHWLSYINALILANQPDMAREVLEIGRQSGLQGESADALAAMLAALVTPPPPPPPMLTEAEQTQRILQLYQGGRFAEAEVAARELTEGHPRNAFGWKVLGTLLAMQGRLADAEPVLLKAAKLSPNDPDIHNNLGNLMNSLGRNEEAIQSFSRAIKLKPDYGDAHYNLGNALKKQNKLEEAVASYRRAIELNPNIAEAHGNLGNVLSDLKQYEAAVLTYKNAISLRPDYVEAHRNLGVAQEVLGHLPEALTSYEMALKFMPEDVDGQFYRAHVLQAENQLELAEEGYRRVLSLSPQHADALDNLGIIRRTLGDVDEALRYFRQAILARPDFVNAHNSLGCTLFMMGKYQEAEQTLLHALEIDADNTGVLNNLGFLAYRSSRFDDAIQYCGRAMAINALSPEAHHHTALTQAYLGRLDEALDGLLTALSINPDYQDAMNNLLFCVNYHPEKSGEEVYRYYEDYEARCGAPLRAEWKAHENDRDSARRLKVGYVSPSFHQHSVRHFLEPLLAHHDKSQVEVYAYAEMSAEDEATRRYQSYADHWINTRGMSDAQLAERIRQDRIDILVDVAGHTGYNRLLTFARKPAPVSLHWLEFGYTTGLKAIDYYLTDVPTIPAGSEHLFSETPWRLPVPAYAYRPDESMGELNPLPAEERGYITFGTLTRSVRINDRVIKAWSAILGAVPNARLVINSGNFKDATMQDWMAERFAQYGIDKERLEIGFQSPAWKVLQSTDIGLDCFPHNSGTTLFESLYMGVPFITLAGRPSVGTLGASILHGIGYPEWIADSEEAYIQKAIALAQDLPLLARHRASLREEMKRGSLMDEAGFASAVEQAYRQMWHKWCGL